MKQLLNVIMIISIMTGMYFLINTFNETTVEAGAQTSAAIHTTAVENNSLTTQATPQKASSDQIPLRSSSSISGGGANIIYNSERINYIALGDSVASGAGLIRVPNASDEDEICDRTTAAYPYLIAEKIKTPVTHLACSGAKIDEGIYGSQKRGDRDIQPQLESAFPASMDISVPTLVTMTVGANDARWTSFIRQCYITRCGTTVDDARAKIYRADLRVELYRSLRQIQQKNPGNPPTVLISGYYTPFNDISCFASERVTASELTWLREQNDALNQAIRSVVPYFPSATYVPINFTDHELCSDEPWVQGLEDSAPFHPTETGHRAIADAFLEKIEN